MTPSQKIKWLAALRSGEYKQGIEMLYNDLNDTYCCLGVVQKVCNFESDTSWNLSVLASDGNMNYIFISDQDQNALITMNDIQNKSFCEIADYIEENIQPDEEDTNDTTSKT